MELELNIKRHIKKVSFLLDLEVRGMWEGKMKESVFIEKRI